MKSFIGWLFVFLFLVACSGGGFVAAELSPVGDTNYQEVVVMSEVENSCGVVKSKKIDIGAWDMDAVNSPGLIPHGLDSSNIIGVVGVVYSDTGAAFPIVGFNNGDGGNDNVRFASITSSSLQLLRVTGGYFDSTLFDDVGINRGRIVVFYVD